MRPSIAVLHPVNTHGAKYQVPLHTFYFCRIAILGNEYFVNALNVHCLKECLQTVQGGEGATVGLNLISLSLRLAPAF